MKHERLARQIGFIVEIDKLKTVLRQTWLMDDSRRENDAEHSWHTALMALLLAEYAGGPHFLMPAQSTSEGDQREPGLPGLPLPGRGSFAQQTPIDVCRAMKMMLVHDLVEIDAGDTFVYDDAAAVGKAEREDLAAARVFGLLPPDQAAEVRGLWEEFEARRTPEARYAAALDRLQPILHNHHTQGKAWRQHGVTSAQVIAHNRHIADSAPALWEFAEGLIRDAVAKGYLAE
jgi:putative hydrolase of HD superfamily